MREIKLYFSKEKNLEDYGFIFFILGIFFLPSTIVIGVLFLLPAFLIASLQENKQFFKEKVKQGEIHKHWENSQKDIRDQKKVKFLIL